MKDFWGRRSLGIYPGHSGDQSRVRINICQFFIDSQFILRNNLGTEKHASIYFGEASVVLNLMYYFIFIFPSFLTYPIDPLADIKVLAISVLAPPFDEGFIFSDFKPDMPVQLGRDVIDPSFLQPFQYIGVEVVI